MTRHISRLKANLEKKSDRPSHPDSEARHHSLPTHYPHPNPSSTENRASQQPLPVMATITTTNFDHYPLAASHLLHNTAYSSLSIQEQRSQAASVGDEINGFFQAILEQARSSDSSIWETKIKAMDAMREMMKLVLLADNVIGEEIRKSKYCVVSPGGEKSDDGCSTWDAKLGEVLMDCWTDEDENKRYFAEEERNGGVMTGRFRELAGLAERFPGVFERMKDILMCVDRDVYVC